jgi:hypothetical protein
MRNDRHEEDQKVYRFINTEGIYYDELKRFLIVNKLPFYERWVFYLFGKMNFFNEKRIVEMGAKYELCYGAHLYPEVFWWKEYLAGELEEMSKILSELATSNLPLNSARQIFVERGWKFVEEMMERDEELAQQLKNYDNDDNADSSVYSIQSNIEDCVCTSCHQRPCICSDMEKTSTLHHY